MWGIENGKFKIVEINCFYCQCKQARTSRLNLRAAVKILCLTVIERTAAFLKVLLLNTHLHSYRVGESFRILLRKCFTKMLLLLSSTSLVLNFEPIFSLTDLFFMLTNFWWLLSAFIRAKMQTGSLLLALQTRPLSF